MSDPSKTASRLVQSCRAAVRLAAVAAVAGAAMSLASSGAMAAGGKTYSGAQYTVAHRSLPGVSRTTQDKNSGPVAVGFHQH